MNVAKICLRLVLLVAMSVLLFILSIAGVLATCLSVVISFMLLRNKYFFIAEPNKSCTI